MRTSNVLLASVAFAFLSGTAVSYAQTMDGEASGQARIHGQAARTNIKHNGYRPLTVGGRRGVVAAPAQTAAESVNGLGAAVASPFNGVAAVGGPVGFGGSVIGGALGGATTLATAPFSGLLGGQVGISNDAAPPLPIKARYAGTGAVTTTLDAGYAQEVPVDMSGPIYQIDNGGRDRSVTPFTLLAFPITGAVSAITSPLRPAPAPRS